MHKDIDFTPFFYMFIMNIVQAAFKIEIKKKNEKKLLLFIRKLKEKGLKCVDDLFLNKLECFYLCALC